MYSRKTVFWAACLGMLLFGVGLITLGSMATDLKLKFSLDDEATGALFSVLPIGILTGSLVFGPVCDRYGYKLILILAGIGMFAGFEGIAWISSLGILKISIFLFGVGAGIINGATNAVVSDVSKGSEGANLSLLGVFFGIGALGMPSVIGFLKDDFSSFEIVGAIGWFTLAVSLFYSFIKFPPAKTVGEVQKPNTRKLFKQKYLWFLALFLFFHGCLEAILNNWTTTYLTKHHSISESNALYALSLYMVGMSVMRLLIGSVFRSVKLAVLVMVSLVIIVSGILFLHFGNSYTTSVIGLVSLGIGSAGGFPIILGLAGNRYPSQSGTAFSFILTIVLLGNMCINYLMGFVSKNYGIKHFTTLAFLSLICLLVFYFPVFRSKKTQALEPDDVSEPKIATV